MLNEDGQGTIERSVFGSLADRELSLFVLRNASGCVLKVTNYGATVTELHVPDRLGQLADIVLGFQSLDEYVASQSYFGCIAGRVANRIRNGLFELDGKSYQLAQNDGPNHLHGGWKGFHRGIWSAQAKLLGNGPAVELKYVSKDGEEGYPGTLFTTVTYQLTNDAEFVVEMLAESDGPTIVNLAHHGYYNLAGHGSGSVLSQELRLNASEYTLADPDPGVTKPVAGSAFDFSEFKTIGRDLEQVGNRPLGYDHNFIVLGAPGELRQVAQARDPKSGRVMTLESDQPGVQFYCGSFLDGRDRGKGARYDQYSGFCLETQKFPYAINVPSWRNQVILRPGELYRHRMVHRFSVD
ncbi:MAG TPA: aldose epimerase family protein [Polyangiaceae bacterium]|jgi:aldose 1-epimerase|nr:aldose epimerase family protein [Polyangiaceae bacterium]